VNAARGLALVAIVLASVAQSPAPPPTGEQILGRVKAVFRAQPRPPYVGYTLTRRDVHDGLPDFENS